MKALLTVALTVFALSASGAVAAEDPGLTKLLSAKAARFPGKFTIYVKHLATGTEASVAGDEPMSAMSVIKLGILVKAYQMAEQKRLDLDQRMTMKAADLRGGSGIFKFHAPGLNPTLRDLLWEMVVTSDNTATDAMVARVGGLDELNRWYATSGFAPMRMNYTISSSFGHELRLLIPKAKDLSQAELDAVQVGQRASELSAVGKAVAAEADLPETWENSCEILKDQEHWLGTISARSVGHLLEQLEIGKLASNEHTAEMTGMLKRQVFGARRIPVFLDGKYAIGHKTGDGAPCIANDVGIIYLKSGPTVVAFLSDQIRGNYGEAELHIGEAARAVAEYFDGK